MLELDKQFLFGEMLAQPVAQACKHRIPDAGTQRSEQGKGAEVHARQAGRNGDELADSGNQSAQEGRNGTVAVKVGLGFLHLFGIDQAHVANAAVGEGIDHGPPDEQRQHIVDNGPDECAQRGNHDNHDDVHVAVAGSKICCWRDNHLARERDKRALDSHQQQNGAVGQMLLIPVVNGNNVVRHKLQDGNNHGCQHGQYDDQLYRVFFHIDDKDNARWLKCQIF